MNMKTTIEVLKGVAGERDVVIDDGTLFRLLAEAECQCCCAEMSGGNGMPGCCPPPPQQ
jgi:hypothetical protein